MFLSNHFFWQFFFSICFIYDVMKINLILQNPTVKKNAPKAFNQFVSLPNLKSDSFIFTGNAETKARNREEDLEMYKKRSQTNPKMAFLYNPDIPKKIREQQAKDDPTIKDVSGLAKTMGLESYLPVVKWLRGEKFDFDLIPRTLLSSAFIDTQSPQNADFLSFVLSDHVLPPGSSLSGVLLSAGWRSLPYRSVWKHMPLC